MSFFSFDWQLHMEFLYVAGDQTKEVTPKIDALKHICSGKDKAFLKESFVNPIKGFFSLKSLFSE